MSKTTILVETETRKLLQKVGRKEQTYDALIRELISKCEECEKESGLSGSGHGLPTSVPAAKQPLVVKGESMSPKELSK